MQHYIVQFNYENPLKELFGPNFLKEVPTIPGVYCFFGEAVNSAGLRDPGPILYIGKAKSLRARLSDYFYARPGVVQEHTLEMIENVRSIRWLECPSEQAALLKESELLHAVRPPYNILGTEPNHYLFIGTREAANRTAVDFKLSSHEDIRTEGYRIHGCYKHRRRVKSGYTALLRLIYAACTTKARFSFPAKLARVSPPWVYTSQLPEGWSRSLRDFLDGKSGQFLQTVFTALLENELIPPFMRPGLQDDIETVKSFYELGPKATFDLKVKNKIRTKVISHQLMDRFISADFPS